MHSLLPKIVIHLKSVQNSKFTLPKLWIIVSYVCSCWLNILSQGKIIWLPIEKNEIPRAEIPKIFNIWLRINNAAKQKSWWWVVSDPIFLQKLLQWDFIPHLALKNVRSFLVLILGRTLCSLKESYVNLVWLSSCEFHGIFSISYPCFLWVLDLNKSKILGLFIVFRLLVHCGHHLVLF